MKTLLITHDLGADKSGFMAKEFETFEVGTTSTSSSSERTARVDSPTYLRIDDSHPNYWGLECEVCGKVIEFGWENFDCPRQSVCDCHVIIVNP